MCDLDLNRFNRHRNEAASMATRSGWPIPDDHTASTAIAAAARQVADQQPANQRSEPLWMR